MTDTSVKELRLKLDVAKAELRLKQAEVDRLKGEIAAIEWEPIEWSELESLLKARPDGGVEHYANPVVGNRGGYGTTYCFITKTGELQVGPYFSNFDFPRGHSLYINKNRIWR